MGSKKKHGNFIGIALVVIVIIAGLATYMFWPSDVGKTIIRTAKVTRGTVSSTVTATGVLQPLTTVSVKSNVGGTVIKLVVQEGQRVKKNQLIALIDPSDSQTALDQAQADLAAATSKVAQTQDQKRMTHQQSGDAVTSAKQALEAVRLKYLQAQEQAKLQKTTTVTSIQQAEQALTSAKAHLAQVVEIARVQPQLTQTAIDQAQSALDNAKAALKQMSTATIPQTLAQAKSDYAQAQANTAYAETNLKRQQALFAKGFVSQGVVDTAIQSAALAKATLANTQQKLDTVKQQTDEDLNQAKTKVGQAQAALANAEANRSQDSQRQQDVAQAKATVQQDEAALAYAKANGVQDQLKLQDVATAKTAWQQQQAALSIAQSNLIQDSINQSNIVQARATVAHNTAAVNTAKTALGYTTILAPSDGVILKKWSDVGTIVTAGRNSVTGNGTGVSIVDMADTSKMFALVNVDETDIARVALNQQVDITLDAYPDELFEGKVTEIAPETTVVSNVTTIPVTVEINLPDQRLKSGMNVTCQFITGQKTDVLMVPNEAVKEGDSGSTVQVIVNDQPVTKNVTAGLAGNDSTEIVVGLNEGERVVTAIVLPKKASAPSTTAAPGGGMGGPGGPGGGMRMGR